MGIAVWGFPWWEASRRGIEWEIEWASNHSAHGCSATDALKVLESIKNESLGYWQQLTDRFPLHGQAATVREWLTTINGQIQRALDDVETCVNTELFKTPLPKRKAPQAPRTSKKKRL